MRWTISVALLLLVVPLAGCLSSSPAVPRAGASPVTSTPSISTIPAPPLPPLPPSLATMNDAERPFRLSDSPLQLLRIIDSESARPLRPFEAFDTMSLNIADLDGDGQSEIVTLNDNNRAYVLSGIGQIVSEFSTPRPGGDAWGARDINGVTIGDLDGDGAPELVILNSAATLAAFRLDRLNSTTTNQVWTRTWNQTVSAPRFDPDFFATHPWYEPGQDELGSDGNPFMLHLADGTALVLAQSDGYPGHFAFSPTGSLRWSTDFWDGNSGPWAGLLEPGGRVMAVFATDGGHVVAYQAASGVIQWDFDARAAGADPGSIPIMPTVFDRGDGTKGIFVGARVAVDPGAGKSRDTLAANATGVAPAWMHDQHAMYFLLDPAGHVVWQTRIPGGNPVLYMHAAPIDINLDGVTDLVVEDWNTIGHHPGNWEKTGPAILFALDGRTGGILWQHQVDARWSNTGLAVASVFAGEGPMVMVPEQLGLQDGLSFFDLAGKRHGWIPVPVAASTVTRGPVVADLDGDGLAEVVLPMAIPATGCPVKHDAGCRAGALAIYGTQARMADVAFSNNESFSN